jgi:hypothetical protein
MFLPYRGGAFLVDRVRIMAARAPTSEDYSMLRRESGGGALAHAIAAG